MRRAVLNKEMDAYLANRRTCRHCLKHHTISTAISCKAKRLKNSLRLQMERIKAFFSPVDIGDAQIDSNKVTVVDTALTPAGEFWTKMKGKVAGKQPQEPEDIDPELVQEVIKKHKV